MIGRCLPLVAVVLVSIGCVVETTGPVKHEFQSLERDRSEYVHVDLNMGAGRLLVGTGTEKLMMADFAYNRPNWQPEVDYHSSSGRGSLSVRQPSTHNVGVGNHKNEWDLRFNRDVPLELVVHFGAGEAELDLGSLSLRDLEVDMGVGQLKLDLRGIPKHDYNVRIRGGVGEATVRLPSEVGVYAEAEGGIGSIDARGMHRRGSAFQNEAYGSAKVNIRMDVRGGIGAIRLISD